MAIASFTVFLLSSLVHLYASAKSDKKLRAYTKGFILLGLLGWYCFSVGEVRSVVVAAILTSWLGDILLVGKGVKWFTAGGISFMASHICFVLAYLPRVSFGAIPVWAVAAMAALYVTLVVLVFRGLRADLPKALFYPMFLYLLINGTMNCFAFYQLFTAVSAGTIITAIGATQFFCSDSLLFYVRFKKNGKQKNHFWVMLTYIASEFLIVQGLILLG